MTVIGRRRHRPSRNDLRRRRSGRRQSREIEQVRTTIDSMAQGLCMFDAAERLVVCNARYYEMYGLSPDDMGRHTLTEVLEKRVAKGTFSRDPQQYRKEFLAAVGEGRTIVHEVKATSGRLLLVTNHPMQGGGWIGTHEDITERRQTEQQHAAMQQQEARRAVLEDAISAFRQRPKTVAHRRRQCRRNARHRGQSVQCLRSCLATRRQRGASSNEASTNVATAAVAADELSHSIERNRAPTQPDRRGGAPGG